MLKQPLGKKRHIIGIMSGYLHADYLSALLEEIDQALQAEEFEIHFFSGSYTSPFIRFPLKRLALSTIAIPSFPIAVTMTLISSSFYVPVCFRIKRVPPYGS